MSLQGLPMPQYLSKLATHFLNVEAAIDSDQESSEESSDRGSKPNLMIH